MLIAEKVFGWTEGRHLMKYTVLPFSTDIAAAWHVVEKMRMYHWRNVLSLIGPEPENGVPMWRAQFSKKFAAEPKDSLDWDGIADAAPHAICIAALEALGALP